MEKQKNSREPLRIYKPSGISQIGLGLMTIFIVVHFSVMMQAGSEIGGFFLFFVPIYALVLWILIISSTQQHLAVYEDGLEYRIGNTRIFSRWENLQSFESRPSGKTRIFGIASSAVEKHQDGGMLESFTLGWRHENFIPLSTVSVPTRWDGCWSGAVVDSEKLAQTEFGSDLLHYAPHLFEYSEDKAKNG